MSKKKEVEQELVADQAGEIAALNLEVERLKEDKEELHRQLETNSLYAPHSIESVVGLSADTLTKNDVIKAVLPQIKLNHARPETQRIMKAVDEICAVIGIDG